MLTRTAWACLARRALFMMSHGVMPHDPSTHGAIPGALALITAKEGSSTVFPCNRSIVIDCL